MTIKQTTNLTVNNQATTFQYFPFLYLKIRKSIINVLSIFRKMFKLLQELMKSQTRSTSNTSENYNCYPPQCLHVASFSTPQIQTNKVKS